MFDQEASPCLQISGTNPELFGTGFDFSDSEGKLKTHQKLGFVIGIYGDIIGKHLAHRIVYIYIYIYVYTVCIMYIMYNIKCCHGYKLGYHSVFVPCI